MKIIKIVRSHETDQEYFTEITFKSSFWRNSLFTKTCITSKSSCSISTIYADNGSYIDSSLWETVNAFLRTNKESIVF